MRGAPHLLALDCTTEWVSVAVADASRLIEWRERASQAHGERLLPLVDMVLRELGIALAGLEAIAFGAGPGSFTGVRIACSAAQGLALGSGVPLVAVGSLETLAERARQLRGANRVFACLDARMREVYVGAYEWEGSRWRECLAPSVLPPAAVSVPPGRFHAVGDGLALLPSLAAHPDLTIVPVVRWPEARAMIGIARRRLAAGEILAPEAALPFYVRHRVALTEAERRAGAVLAAGQPVHTTETPSH
jgi:tRNA threonylcarbamoyladenosine biosynthesis protein TsaB